MLMSISDFRFKILDLMLRGGVSSAEITNRKSKILNAQSDEAIAFLVFTC